MQSEIFPGGKMLIEDWQINHAADIPLYPFPVFPDRHILKTYFSIIRTKKTCRQLQQGGFSRPVLSHQRIDAPFRYAE